MVRFNETGTIDARNGGAFRADLKLRYVPGTVYHVRMVVDVPAKSYSVFVTPSGQHEAALALNYAFRSQQSSVRTLRKLVLAGFKAKNAAFRGTHRVTGVSVTAISR
jgi:hypothetical protein